MKNPLNAIKKARKHIQDDILKYLLDESFAETDAQKIIKEL
jgi:hypothetical protein